MPTSKDLTAIQMWILSNPINRKIWENSKVEQCWKLLETRNYKAIFHMLEIERRLNAHL